MKNTEDGAHASRRGMLIILSLLLSSSAYAQVGTNHVLHSWFFSSNTLVDVVSNYRAGLSNGATLTAEGVVLDGVDDYIELDAIPTNAHYSGAICLRLKPAGDDATSVGLIDSFLRLNSTARAEFHFGLYNGSATAGLPTDTLTLSAPVGLTSNREHTIVFSWDAMWYYFYFDGKLWGKILGDRYSNIAYETLCYPDVTGKIKIGIYTNSGPYFFAGTVTEVRFQDYMMTPAEATAWHSRVSIDGKEKMEDLWYPQRGELILSKGPPGSFYEESVMEPSIIVKPDGSVNMLFLARNNALAHSCGLATAPSPEGPYTVVKKVIGTGTDCVYGSAHQFVIQDQGIDSPHCFLYSCDGNDGTVIQLFESNDYGWSWTFKGIACPREMLNVFPPEERGIYGNTTIWPEKQADGYYYGIVEWSISTLTGAWRTGLMRSTSLTNGWQIVQRFDQLNVPAYPRCSATAPDMFQVDGKWVMFFGANGDEDISYARTLPDLFYFAWSSDLLRWRDSQKADRMYAKYQGYYTDQRSDVEVKEIGGWPYYFHDSVKNGGVFESSIYVKKGKYPLSQLINTAIRNNLTPLGSVISFGTTAAAGGSGQNSINSNGHYSDSFEDYTNGTPIVGAASGWSTIETNFVQIVSNEYAYGLDYPINGTNHHQVLSIDSPTTNQFEATTNQYLTFYADLVLQPRRWDGETPPPDTNNVLTTIYVTSNGTLAAYCSDGPSAAGPFTNAWVEFPQTTPIATGAWVRLTVTFKFRPQNSSFDYFQVQYGNEYLSNSIGQTNVDSFAGPRGGSWFLCAKNNGHVFRYIGMSGCFMMDDLVVTTNKPAIAEAKTVRIMTDGGANTIPNIGLDTSMDVSVTNGNSLNVAWSGKTGYTVTNAFWGEGLGAQYATNAVFPATNKFFSSITTNCTVKILTGIEPRYLVISNPAAKGTASPAVGTWACTYGQSVTCSIAGSPTDVGAATQTACVGYTRTVSSSTTQTSYHGSIMSTTFNIEGATTSDFTVVTWNWQPQYWFRSSVNGIGFVDVEDQWCTSNLLMTVAARADEGFTFVNWTGDTNGVTPSSTNKVIQVRMDRAKSLTANFSGTTNRTSRGTLYTWLQKYYRSRIANGGPVAFEATDETDIDGDTLNAWQEYIAGTDPSDPSSAFQVLSIEYMATSNCVTFYGTTNSGVTSSFGMLESTNLMIPWFTSTITVERTASGTNRWVDPAPLTNVPVFYRPVATNMWD